MKKTADARSRRSVRYPHAQFLMITAEGGGSSRSRLRSRNYALGKFVNELGLTGHYSPPGTSMNRVEQSFMLNSESLSRLHSPRANTFGSALALRSALV